MAVREIPTPETLRQLLRYESETGKLYWLPRSVEMFPDNRACRSWNTKHAGREALTAASGGYQVGNILGKQFKAHRVAWVIHYGKWPEQDIDHLNGNTSDNRIENLRDCSHSENHRNRWQQSNNSSGVPGVCWDRRDKRWYARIGIKGKEIRLGAYATFEEAVAARNKASIVFGFTARHGTKAKT